MEFYVWINGEMIFSLLSSESSLVQLLQKIVSLGGAVVETGNCMSTTTRTFLSCSHILGTILDHIS
jgi:hypothetical protein